MAAENFKVKKGLEVGTAITATSSGVNVTGVVTATQFVGDGSGLTGVTGSGSGVVIKHDGSAIGTASTINFSTNLDVSAISAGIVTVTASGGDVVNDTTPQLGGNLDLDGKFINGTGGANITGVVTATTGDFVNLDVDGETDLDDVVISGVTTFSVGPVAANGQFYRGIINSGSQQKIVGGYINGSDTLRLGESMYLSSTGLGIGSESPTQKLDVNGSVKATGADINGNADILGNLDVDGQTDLDDVVVAGVSTFNDGITLGTNSTTFAAKFADDAVANFGTDNDLQISHDNSNALIRNSTGKIVVVGVVSATSGANITGVVTATTFSGSGASLTNLPSGQLSGALPALDGSALTGVTASGSGIVVKHDGTTVGTAGTVNFSTNLDVTAVSAGIVTITASGGGAAGLSTDAYGNTFGGHLAGNALTSGSENNTLVGRNAGTAINTGDHNVCMGYNAGASLQAGYRNIVIGNNAGDGTNFTTSTIVGYDAAGSSPSAFEYSAFFGYQAGGNSTSSYSVYVGRSAGNRHSGNFNIIIGDSAGNTGGVYGQVTGTKNVILGAASGTSVTSAGSNTIIGYDAGDALTTGSNNLILGNQAAASAVAISNEITFGNDNITKLRVPGIGLSFTSAGAVISGIVTATSFSGSGANLTSLDAGNLGVGTIPNGRFPATLPAVSGANLTSLNADNISSGTLASARIEDEAVTFAKMQHVGTGVFIGRNDGGTGDIETMTAAEARTLLNVADGANVGITTFQNAAWTVGNNSSSNYVISGPGGLSSANNPDLHLVRGQTYQFIMNASGHGFGIQTVSGSWSSGNEYTTGITNAQADSGTITFAVPYTAPARLYYACTSNHGGMVGNIYVRGAGGHDDKVGVTTITGGLLHIKDNASPAIRLQDNNNVNSDFKIYSPDGDNHLRIYHENTTSDLVTLTSAGKLLVGGQTSPRSAWFNQSNTFQPAIQVEGSGEPGNQYMSLTANNNASGYGARFLIGKTRGTTAGAVNVVNDDDEIGGISWFGSDGNEMVEAAHILSYVDGATGSNDMPGSLRFSTTADTQSSPTEALRIDSSGRVQIGSSTLAARNTFNGIGRLNLQNNSQDGTVDFTQGIVFTNNASNEGTWTHGGIVCTGSTGYDGNMVFGTDGSDARDMSASSITEKMRLTADGQLLINKVTNDSTTHLLQLYAEGTASCNGRITTGGLGNNGDLAWSAGAANRDTAFGVFKNANNNPGGYMRLDTEDDTTTYAWFDNSRVFRVSGNYQDIGTTSGTIVGTQGSDIRLKDLVDDGSVSYGLSEINQITPIKFKYKKDPRTDSEVSDGNVIKTRIGFSAQQVKPIIPEAVYDTGEQVEGEDNIMAMEYVNLIPVLTNAVKELSTEIDKLKAEIAALKSS